MSETRLALLLLLIDGESEVVKRSKAKPKQIRITFGTKVKTDLRNGTSIRQLNVCVDSRSDLIYRFSPLKIGVVATNEYILLYFIH